MNANYALLEMKYNELTLSNSSSELPVQYTTAMTGEG